MFYRTLSIYELCHTLGRVQGLLNGRRFGPSGHGFSIHQGGSGFI